MEGDIMLHGCQSAGGVGDVQLFGGTKIGGSTGDDVHLFGAGSQAGGGIEDVTVFGGSGISIGNPIEDFWML